jgi:D-3-phosphoglycerate dehydrogenase
MNQIVYVNVNSKDYLLEDTLYSAAGMKLSIYNSTSLTDALPRIQEADALVVTLEKVTSNIMESMPNLKVIGRMGVGVDSLDIEAATRLGIPIINVPDYCVEEVALHAASMMLAAHRKLLPANIMVKERRWSSSNELMPIDALSNLTLGLLGMGRIGSKVIEYMRGFVSRVLVYDPFLKVEQLPAGVEQVSFDQLLAESDILTLHCPLTPETKYSINRKAIEKMKKQPIIVNVSRGPLIHEGDLLDALESGAIRYAALDVLEQEPPPHDHPLLDHPKVLVTNHLAWYSSASLVRLREYTVNRVIDYLLGRSVPTIVNRKALEITRQ